MNEDGYDGQYYYLITSNLIPPLNEARDSYRQQRIIYPLLAKTLSFNQVDLIPFSLIFINLSAIIIGTFIFWNLTSRSLMSTLIFSLNPAYILGLQYDLIEPLAITMSLAAFYYFNKQRHLPGLLFFSLAVLTKEVTLAFLAPLIIYLFLKKRYKLSLIYSAAPIPFLLYSTLLRVYSKQLNIGINSGLHSFSFPFEGVITVLLNSKYFPVSSGIHTYIIIFFLILLVLFLAISFEAVKKSFNFIAFCMVFIILTSAFYSEIIWSSFMGAARSIQTFYILAPLIYLKNHGKLVTLGMILMFIIEIFTLIRPFVVSPKFIYTII